MLKEDIYRCSHCEKTFAVTDARWLRKEQTFGCYLCGDTHIQRVEKCAECCEYYPVKDLTSTTFYDRGDICPECLDIVKYLVNNKMSMKDFKKFAIKTIDNLKKDNEIKELKKTINILKDENLYEQLKMWINFQAARVV